MCFLDRVRAHRWGTGSLSHGTGGPKPCQGAPPLPRLEKEHAWFQIPQVKALLSLGFCSLWRGRL